MTYYYFAYGMNTNLDQMSRRCPTAVCIGPARIDNYRLVFRGVADIEPASEEYCDGVLWELQEADLAALDLLEGFPYHYIRFWSLAYTDTHNYACLVYQMIDQSTEQPPSDYYFGLLYEGYKANGVPLDQLLDYVDYQ